MSEGTGAAVIFGASGGVMEAALRTVYRVVTGSEMPSLDLHAVRGMENLKEAEITIGDLGPQKVAVVHGPKAAARVIADVNAGKSPYLFIEVMACPGGCIGGGGTSRRKDDAALPQRQQSLYDIDRANPERQSHVNVQVQNLYRDYLGEPCSHLAHELLHTETYVDRKQAGEKDLADVWQKIELR